MGENGKPGAAKNMHVSPKETSLKTGQSTTVDITLVDCDGKPLADREISLVDVTDDKLGLLPGTTGGTVTPSQVRTDEGGKATVTFQAGSAPGMGVIRANSIYLRPPGNKLAFQAEGYVNIEEPYPVYLLEADLICLHTANQDYRTGPDLFGSTLWQFEQTIEQSRFMFRRILHRYDPGYPCVPADCGIFKYKTGGDLSSTGAARYWHGYAFYNSYKVYAWHSVQNDIPHDRITLTAKGHHIDLAPYNSNTFIFNPGDLLLLSVDSEYKRPEFFSEYNTNTGWRDTVTWSTGIDGPSISCRAGDQGAQFTWNQEAGIFTATCVQIKDKDQPVWNIKEHTENRVFVTLRRIANGKDAASENRGSQVKP